jgi:hypothetical protein
MGFRANLAGILAIVGGVLMFGSGYSSRGFLYQALNLTEPQISNLLSGIEASVVVLAIIIVETLIALGGLTVLAGGALILFRHITIGRILIFFGGGAGFLGLLISFGYSIFKLGGLDPVLSYLPYWVGLVMAIVARRMAKGG